MADSVNLVLPYPPSSNRYWRTRAVKGICMTYVSPEAQAYKKTVKEIAALDALIYSDIAVTVRVFRPQRSGDMDNRRKVLYDAMQGVIYANDSQIVEDHGYRAEDKFRPRVEVEIKILGLL